MPSLTTAQAAARLGISIRAVQALINRGRLKASLFGRVWAVEEKSVEAFKPLKAGRKRKGLEKCPMFTPSPSPQPPG